MATCGCAERICCAATQPLVGVGGGHADVDDRDIWGIGRDEPDQLLGGAHGGRDFDALLGQEPCQALTDDDRVVGEDHAHGMAAVTRVPRPGGLSITRRPSSASTRSRKPLSPAPPASAPPIPSSVTSTATLPLTRLTSIVTRDACACLTTLASASDATKYAVASTGAGSRSPQAVTTTGTGARRARAPSAGASPLLGEDRRVDSPRERAQLVQCVDGLGVRVSEQVVDCGATVRQLVARELERQPDAEQALLGAVVQVALESTPLGVAG